MRVPSRWTTRLAVGLALAALAAAPSYAQTPNYVSDRTSAPLPPSVTFSRMPTWEVVPGTHVSVVRLDERPSFDLFAYGNEYFVYNRGYWYRSTQLNGPYLATETTTLPADFYNVPRERWISFPEGWPTKIAEGRTVSTTVGTNWTPTVTFSTAPHWIAVPGTRVYRVHAAARPPFDLFRYESNYYVYQNENWYRAASTNGPYVAIASDQVPAAFRSVRRNQWVKYPAGWTTSK